MIIHTALKNQEIAQAYQSALNYPQLAKMLADIGVLSYTVETSSGAMLYRFENGFTIYHDGIENPRNIETKFNELNTIQTIRNSQAGKINYSEFMDGIAESGVRFYEATLHGPNKRVCYYGIGGMYQEEIPQI